MDAQLIVVIAGALLAIAIVVALVLLRGKAIKFTFDTDGGTQPRASQGEGNTSSRMFKGRFSVLTGIVGAMFSALGIKLYSMQMVSSDYYENKAKENQTRTVTTQAPRGRILDRNGKALVTNRGSLTVAAYQSLASDTLLVHHLANVLGLPYIQVLRNIQDYSEGAQSLHTIATDVKRSTIAYIQEHAGDFPGVHVVEGTERLYPYGDLASHLLGYTGTITSDQLEKQNASSSTENSEEDSGTGAITYQSGDIVGQAGIESQYENILQGIRGEQKVKVNASGGITGVASTVDPKAGSDIKLTIDVDIQKSCEEGIQIAIDKAHQYGNEGSGASCICLDVTNGEILGIASYPKFDPSVFIGGISSDTWNEFNSDEGSHPLIDRAISGQYMSASTIKPLAALAGMEYGVYTASQTSDCTGYWTGLGKANGKWCWDHSGHGVIGLERGIVFSCDSVFYDVGKGFYYDKQNPEGLQEMYRRHGLGAATGIDLPGESSGRIPDKEWKNSYFKDLDADERTWTAGDMTNIAIGQGDILVTPLQMACVYAGLANGGVQYTPHVLLSAISSDGEDDVYKYNAGKSKRRLKAKINASADLDLVHNGLLGVIYDEDESTASHFTNLPVKVAGKTGTGEKSGEDNYAWFCCYAPYDKPKYAIVCSVEQGGFGSQSAIHAARNVLGQIYNSPDDSSASGANVR